MSPEYVRPYVKARKNDDCDAEAIAEAATRPTMRFVTLKFGDHPDVQTLHRVRDRLVGDRTLRTDRTKSLLLESAMSWCKDVRACGRGWPNWPTARRRR